MIHYLFHITLQGVRPAESILISLPMKGMSVPQVTQKVKEERLKQQRKRLGCLKGVITKKLKSDSFKKTKLLTLMTSVQTSKENIIQCLRVMRSMLTLLRRLNRILQVPHMLARRLLGL
ncbi:hypothetical protein AVEN_150226-1 [Araneus ventricosus]|uniref:Uncharacterized protein n=1 Tax=Araneus ventricosus TaxID=182803 RepID=A0A4Y2G9N7_ARAVE|nr:hypothetical protein AVEN_150226-1 [Araneus ventricosus]